ncbi:glycosyl transferase [Tistrella bauzanensis]|uniref:Glycosyl transferase n=2 Tax=Tistrella bauzanensis TaxID=657419 RepID=A0ABQ1IJA8_9PROT|nr:glycosyl transferase [Tistrella bauzanensis]
MKTRGKTRGWIGAVAVTAVIALGNVAFWALPNQHERELPAVTEPLLGAAYSPFRPENDPKAGEEPTLDQVREDLSLVATTFREIRTYSSLGIQGQVPAIARERGLKVTMGSWLDKDEAKNDREIESLVQGARRNPNVTRVLVGNESILRADQTVDQVIARIRQVKSQVRQPVSTAEPWHVWLEHPELGRAADFLAIHILPYWEGLTVDQSIEHTVAMHNRLKRMFPGKPILIAEAGWPSDGRAFNAAQPSLAQEAKFIRKLNARAKAEGISFYLMEAFDQPWKRYDEGGVGAYWGYWNADRQPKFDLTGPVAPLPAWPAIALAAALIALPLNLYFLGRRRDVSWTGRIAFVALVQASAGLVAWVGYRFAVQYMDISGAVAGGVLAVMMGMLVILLLSQTLEFVEVLFARGRKRPSEPVETAPDGFKLPKVSIHVPAYNEPADMMRETLTALARLDYPDFEVLVIDNNTKDEAVWRPLERICEELGPRFRFFHVSPLAGFKAGALNYARHNMADDAEVVAVIDADYVVSPDWLRKMTPHFADETVGFVQSPQDHRDWQDHPFKAATNWEYAGFFDIGMVQRNDHNAIVQHGTMTMIRRAALESVGGWSEWCICEDTELGLRLMENGWSSVYSNHRFGWGVTPDSFMAYKKQRFRWAYGGMQIMRAHMGRIVGRTPSALKPMQKYHFLSGWAGWAADAVGLIIAVMSVIWGALAIAFPAIVELPSSLFVVPALAGFAIRTIHIIGLYQGRVNCSIGNRLAACLAGLSLSFTIGTAVLYGLVTRHLPFFRTPKAENQPALMQAFQMARNETILAVSLVGVAIGISIVYAPFVESRFWVTLMLLQAANYGSSLVMALVAALPARKARKTAAAVAIIPNPADGSQHSAA